MLGVTVMVTALLLYNVPNLPLMGKSIVTLLVWNPHLAAEKTTLSLFPSDKGLSHLIHAHCCFIIRVFSGGHLRSGAPPTQVDGDTEMMITARLCFFINERIVCRIKRVCNRMVLSVPIWVSAIKNRRKAPVVYSKTGQVMHVLL